MEQPLIDFNDYMGIRATKRPKHHDTDTANPRQLKKKKDSESESDPGNPAKEQFLLHNDEDLMRCVEALQHHNKCTDSCFKSKDKLKANCRYGFPKNDQCKDCTFVKYELSKSKKNPKTYISLEPKRSVGDERVNQYCISLLELIRCNHDMKVICDSELCYHYLLKYVTK